MRLWLDDVRPAPPGWVWAHNYAQAATAVKSGKVTFISFDHDLGEEKSGYDLAVLIEELASQDAIARFGWQVHSANPVGKIRIQVAMKSADKLWQAWAEAKSECGLGFAD